MKKHFVRRSTSFLAAVILIAAMSVSALACGVYYYVTYELNDNAALPEDAFDHTLGQDADFEMDSYDYREENGTIIVDFDAAAAEGVSYEVSDSQAPANNAEAVDLTEQNAGFELSRYSYTEENGTIIVDLSGAGLD